MGTIDYGGQQDSTLRRLAQHGDQDAAWAYRQRQRRDELHDAYRRQQYEERVAWAAWRLFINKYTIVILLLVGLAWWFGIL